MVVRQTEQEIREYYRNHSGYFKFIGVTEEEYWNDNQEGRRLDDLAKSGLEEDKYNAEHHHNLMAIKYDEPFQDYVRSLGLTMEQWDAFPHELQARIQKEDTEFVKILKTGGEVQVQVGFRNTEIIARGKEDPNDRRPIEKADFKVGFVKNLIKNRTRELAELTGQPEGVFNAKAVKEAEEFFLGYREGCKEVGHSLRADVWIPMLGCILGQAIVNECKGKWVLGVQRYSNGRRQYQPAVQTANGQCFPFEKVRKLIRNGAEDSIYQFFFFIKEGKLS